MEKNYELRIAIHPIDRPTDGETAVTIRDEMTMAVYDGITLDEAIINIFTKNPSHFHPYSALRERLDYVINDVAMRGETAPNFRLKLVAVDKLNRVIENGIEGLGDIYLALKGRFDDLGKELQRATRDYAKGNGEIIIPLVTYSPTTMKTSFTDPEFVNTVKTIQQDRMATSNSLDVVRRMHIDGDPRRTPRGLDVDFVTRIEGLSTALQALLLVNLSKGGKFRSQGAGNDLMDTYLITPAQDKMLLFVRLIQPGEPKENMKAGMYLQVVDPPAVEKILEKEPSLRGIITDLKNPIPIALSNTDSYKHMKASDEIISFLKTGKVAAEVVQKNRKSKRDLKQGATKKKRGL